jgi:hypothetical protein
MNRIYRPESLIVEELVEALYMLIIEVPGAPEPACDPFQAPPVDTPCVSTEPE